MRESLLKNPEVGSKIRASISVGMKYKDACAVAGVTERVFYYWKKRAEKTADKLESGELTDAKASECIYFQFFQSLKEAEAKAKLSLLSKIKTDPSWQSKAWILERRYPDEWGRREKIDLTAEINTNVHDELLKASKGELGKS